MHPSKKTDTLVSLFRLPIGILFDNLCYWSTIQHQYPFTFWTIPACHPDIESVLQMWCSDKLESLQLVHYIRAESCSDSHPSEQTWSPYVELRSESCSDPLALFADSSPHLLLFIFSHPYSFHIISSMMCHVSICLVMNSKLLPPLI